MKFYKRYEIAIFWLLILILLILFLPNILRNLYFKGLNEEILSYNQKVKSELIEMISELENKNNEDLDKFYIERDLLIKEGKVNEGESVIHLRGFSKEYDKSKPFPHEEVGLKIIER